MCLCESRLDLADELTADRLRLWQLPSPLRGLYFLGETVGYQAGLEHSYPRIEALESECDRLYTELTRGKTKPQPLTPSFAELCRIRGQHALADLTETDWQRLVTDHSLSRFDLIEERRKTSLKPQPPEIHFTR